jgi:hypothetical protein
VRSALSRADSDTLASLAQDGLAVSQAQLERWRQRGLIPRAVVARRRFGGSQAMPHPQSTVDAVRLLAAESRRGRPWQYNGRALFEVGLPLSSQALRACAAYDIECAKRFLTPLWREADLAAPREPDDALGDLTNVANTAADFASRHRWTADVPRVARRLIQLIEPELSKAELDEAVERATTWRLADMFAPNELGDEQRQLARYGSVMRDPNLPILPLPSEALACSRTLTRAEAYLTRLHTVTMEELRGYERGGPHLLDEATWDVAYMRINMAAHGNPSRPAPQSVLDAVADEIKGMWEQYAPGSPDVRQMPLWESRS